MGIEIEKKFLVKNNSYKKLAEGIYCIQGYLQTSPECTVRVRISDQKAYITVKGLNKGAVRPEYEYPIPVGDAQEILRNLCPAPVVEKYRYMIEYGGFVWEIDEFLGDNSGLCIAEIELPSEDTVFSKPDFIGDEVTNDHRYYNSYLATNPYKSWTT